MGRIGTTDSENKNTREFVEWHQVGLPETESVAGTLLVRCDGPLAYSTPLWEPTSCMWSTVPFGSGQFEVIPHKIDKRCQGFDTSNESHRHPVGMTGQAGELINQRDMKFSG